MQDIIIKVFQLKINNTLFFNPWNLWRVVRDYEVKEEIHTPEFIEVKIDNNYNIEYKHRIIPYKKYTEAFDISKIEVYKNIKKDVFNFFKSIDLENFNETDEISILEKIKMKKIKEGSNLDPILIQEVIQELNQKFMD